MFDRNEIERAIIVIKHQIKVYENIIDSSTNSQLNHSYKRDIESLELTLKVLEFAKPKDIKCFTYTYKKVGD